MSKIIEYSNLICKGKFTAVIPRWVVYIPGSLGNWY